MKNVKYIIIKPLSKKIQNSKFQKYDSVDKTCFTKVKFITELLLEGYKETDLSGVFSFFLYHITQSSLVDANQEFNVYLKELIIFCPPSMLLVHGD